MPDRKLTDEEIRKFIHGTHAPKDRVDFSKEVFMEENSEPSLHDVVLTELLASKENHTDLIVEIAKSLNAVRRTLGLPNTEYRLSAMHQNEVEVVKRDMRRAGLPVGKEETK